MDQTILVVSDIHYAGDAERQRGTYELQVISNPGLRLLVRFYRHFIWLRDPFAHNHLLDDFLARAQAPDWVVANGDYSCDSAFVGVSDAAACQSAHACLGQLRKAFGSRFLATLGDHELGKKSLVGGAGGLRLESWRSSVEDLGLSPFWERSIGSLRLMGVCSTLVGLPVYQPEALAQEWDDWQRLREDHLAQIRNAFASLRSGERVLLFCHDPTALPFLWEEEVVRKRTASIERTIIGHLHSDLVFRQARLLAGIPTIGFLGHSVRRMSAALRRARHWQPFRPLLCPSLAGIELTRRGGHYRIEVDVSGQAPARFTFIQNRSRENWRERRGSNP